MSTTEQQPTPAVEDEDVPDYTTEDLEAYFAGDLTDEPPVEQPETEPADPGEDPSGVVADAGDEGGEVAPATQPADEEPTPLEPEPQPAAAQQPEPEPQPAAATTEPDEFVRVGDRLVPRTAVEEMFTWAQSLTAEQWARVDAALSGQPVHESAPQQQAAPGAGQPSPGAAGPPPEFPDDVDPEFAQALDARLSARLGPVEQRLAQIAQLEEQRIAREQQAREAEMREAVAEARRGVSEQFGLSDAELEELEARATASGVMSLIAQRDMQVAPNRAPIEQFREALESTLWTTPQFRQRAIEAQVAAATTEARQSVEIEERRQRAAALAGTGAVAPRVTAPKEPTTREEREQGLIAEVAKAKAEGIL